MNALPDTRALRALLARFARRLTLLAALRGVARGLVAALLLALAVTAIRQRTDLLVSSGLALLGAAAGVLLAVRKKRPVALLVERQAPQCRNLVITAAELLRAPQRTTPFMAQQVWGEATRLLGALDPRGLFPARREVGFLAATSVAWASALVWFALHAATPGVARTGAGEGLTGALIDNVMVVATPPAYTGRAAITLHNPDRIEALQGSRIQITVSAEAAAVTMETLDGRQALRAEDGAYIGELTADADGYIALEPATRAGRPGVRRLIGVNVLADSAPRVRVTAPGRDLFIPDANRAIDVTIESSDDIALSTLELRYTKASGSGEQIKFTDGTIPLVLERTDGRRWKGRAALRLPALDLQPGDLVVYRGAATDQRPGAARAESDSYIVEITTPGSTPAEGFSADDEEKYALSQEMVVLKTERLMARASSLAPDSLAYETLRLAAEQRSVRAEFVFMMGGEVAEEVLAAAGLTDLNEEAEAQRENDLAAGRLANRGTIALVQAIRAMSRANSALTDRNLAQALIEEKTAVTHLQRAFSHTRYILRALVQRERLDLSRRLTGELSAAAPAREAVQQPALDQKTSALRQALAALATIAAQRTFDAETPGRLSLLATRILREDPSSEPLQGVAKALNDAALGIGVARINEARALIDGAATQLSAAIRTQLVAARAPDRPAQLTRLEGALRDAQRAPRQ